MKLIYQNVDNNFEKMLPLNMNFEEVIMLSKLKLIILSSKEKYKRNSIFYKCFYGSVFLDIVAG